jgi:predicted metal-dependent HD superfamily phosphohydrolase
MPRANDGPEREAHRREDRVRTGAVGAARLRESAWRESWRQLGASAPEGLFAELNARYSEPHRSYHTLQHLDECFAALEPARHLAERLPELELAIWFHDAVYDTHAGDSEERSARWAEERLRAGGVGAEATSRIGALILATRHAVRPEERDARLLVDADLAILAAARPRFEEYERQVRQEYDWVPEPAFRAGRARILQGFVDRPSIYSTPWFAERFETRARENLRRSLMALTV